MNRENQLIIDLHPFPFFYIVYYNLKNLQFTLDETVFMS